MTSKRTTRNYILVNKNPDAEGNCHQVFRPAEFISKLPSGTMVNIRPIKAIFIMKESTEIVDLPQIETRDVVLQVGLNVINDTYRGDNMQNSLLDVFIPNTEVVNPGGRLFPYFELGAFNSGGHNIVAESLRNTDLIGSFQGIDGTHSSVLNDLYTINIVTEISWSQ